MTCGLLTRRVRAAVPHLGPLRKTRHRPTVPRTEARAHGPRRHRPHLDTHPPQGLPFTIKVLTSHSITCARTQFPLEPAHAKTIHHDQGSTRVNPMGLAMEGFNTDGMCYTGISRPTALSLLFLKDFKESMIHVNKGVLLEMARLRRPHNQVTDTSVSVRDSASPCFGLWSPLCIHVSSRTQHITCAVPVCVTADSMCLSVGADRMWLSVRLCKCVCSNQTLCGTM